MRKPVEVLTVNISQENIDNGKKNTAECPIALALLDLYGPGHVNVGVAGWSHESAAKGHEYHYGRINLDALRFQQKFSEGLVKEPTSVTLSLWAS